ncbi:MAG: tetratricopeptide repeat protein, partial [Sandaracinaceae bacterium]
KVGFVCGTPEFMAPEQARGDPFVARSDIYSAGTVLYQMLCGRVPFTAENALGVITRHLMDEPTPPSDVQPTWGIPASLEAVALKALAKDPDDRFASAKDMSRAVARAVSDLGARANERLGHGSFLRTADEVEAARAKALADKSERDLGTRATIEHPSVAPPAGRGWLYALGGAFAVLAFGIYLWTTRTVEPVASPSPTVNAPVSHHPEPSPRTRPATQPAVTSDRTPQVDPIVEPIGPRAPSQPALPSDPTIEAPSAPTHDRVRPDAPHGRRRAATDPSTASAPEPPATGGPASALEESRALIRQGDIAGAIARLETAARAHPSHAQIQRTLGQAYMRNGDAERGVAAYRRYLELAPNASDRAIIERIVTPRGE